MFSDEKNIDNLEALVKELKSYVELQRDYFQLDLVQKLSILIATMTVALLVIVFITIGLFYLSFMVAYALESLVGSLSLAYALIGLFFFALAGIAYYWRKQLILQPIVHFLAQLFLHGK